MAKDHEKKTEARRNKLHVSHLKEIARKKADATNLGAYVGDTFIHSKTDQGHLKSFINTKDKITHNWQPIKMPKRTTSDGYLAQGNPTAFDESIA